MKLGDIFFVKKWKMGGSVFVKMDLSSTQGALCTVSVFFILHFTYLEGAYAPNAPPPAYGPGKNICSASQPGNSWLRPILLAVAKQQCSI